MALFGTSGARGVTNLEIKPELALTIATIYGTMMGEGASKAKRMVVGHDQRHGAAMLARVVAAGLASTGVGVDFLGCVSTGVFSSYLHAVSSAGGVLVTGSHMPPDRIGIIPMHRNAHYCDRDITDIIEKGIAAWPQGIRRAPSTCIGEIEEIRQEDSGALYQSRMLEGIRFPKSPLRFNDILVDAGNGTGGIPARTLMSALGFNVVMMNGNPKAIPDRPSECRPDTCALAIERVRKEGYALGVCYDGDADRALFITSGGVALADSVVGAIFARYCVPKGRPIVTPVNASGLIEVIADRIGSRVVYCRIGQPATDTAVFAHDAVFAYEEAAGKYGFAENGCCYDGVYATAMMLRIMQQQNKSLGGLAVEMPDFFQTNRKVAVPDDKKAQVVQNALALVTGRLRDVRNIVTLDGTKFILADGAWLLVRPSGTEPVVRCYSDAQSKQRADELANLGQQCFAEVIASMR